MRCSYCGYDVDKYKELLEEYNRLYRFMMEIANRVEDIEDDKSNLRKLLKDWLKEELK